ncbi:MAG: AAA family ATPase [Hahellaceae bacterium]|nr:AAA family ATPase [Hahellaceae bacterium]MCP5210760.1 AAA family ATPase [Hahellaceae bacterium]
MSQELIAALQNHRLYDHDVDQFTVLETHISWVILTGKYAYKIKKPMNFGFLDFTTLEKRKFFCEQEVRLNQRLAPEVYLGVIPITGSLAAPQPDGSGEPIEYAVKMLQFDQSGLFDKLLEKEGITLAHITTLADTIASFHKGIVSVAADSVLGSAASVFEPMQQNFDQVRPMLETDADRQQLDNLEAWTQATFQRLTPLLEKRKADGKVKECHGDIHLGNITLVNDKVTLFDCIEFNEEFRCIDTISDLAFLVMDLEDRGLNAYANRLLNRYMEQSGDFESLSLLNFYKAYRAVVRAKIALFMRCGDGLDESTKADLYQRYQSYANLAESYSYLPHRFLLIGHGVSGSGKTTVGNALVDDLGVIQIRSDVERKRIFDLGLLESSKSEMDGGIYTADASEKTYARLEHLAQDILKAGYAVFIDATNLKKQQRDLFSDVAESEGVASILVSCVADLETVRGWIKARSNDASEATIAVMEKQLASQDPLTAEELVHAITLRTDNPEEVKLVIATIRQRLGLQ